ncbi:LacI family transcriptional regulator [bacterium]|nr:MAG: LacI family transcriptional regulator [bacterium]
MSVTLEDVAKRANLNIGSVSRILNGKGTGYSDQTRQRVFDTANELGYRPNMLARALQTGRTNTIALCVPFTGNYSPYLGYLYHCLQAPSTQYHYQLITEIIPEPTAEPLKKPQLMNWPVDGIICSYIADSSVNYLQSLVKRGCPIVHVQQSHMASLEHYTNIDYVLIDLYSGAQQAIKHLLESGCHRIAFVGQQYIYEEDIRARAYRELMSAAGKQPEHVVTEGGTRICGYEGLKAYIQSHGCPDGIFCPNDEFAIGCYLAMQEMGIQVPNDTLLVGFDGLENARLFSCPISSVVIPVEKMCALAWEMLVERIENPSLPSRQIQLETSLEVRASSKRDNP